MTKLEKSRDFDRRTIGLRHHENAFRRVLRTDHWVLRFRVQPDRAGKFAVIDPMSEDELVLVLDV